MHSNTAHIQYRPAAASGGTECAERSRRRRSVAATAATSIRRRPAGVPPSDDAMAHEVYVVELQRSVQGVLLCATVLLLRER